MNMDEAHYLLDKYYREVRENEDIDNPVAYALYQAWKIADGEKKSKAAEGGKLMFKVKCKYIRNPKPLIVYSVRKADNGTTEFLLFQCGEWYWRDADAYEPWEEEV